MPTSNKNDAKSFSKLALLASAAATAAFVISQTRLMQRLAEPAPSTPAPAPPDRDEPPANDVPQDEPHDALLPETAELDDDETGEDDDSTPPPTGGGRLRFHVTRPARERLHYGLPVRDNRGSRGATPSATARNLSSETVRVIAPRIETAAAVALLPPPAPAAKPSVIDDDEEFDAEYIAICEAIARDGRLDGDEDEDEPKPATTATAAATRNTIEDLWWLPAPRLRYILLALTYVAIAAAVGSDPVTLAVDGARALTTVNDAAGLVLLAWLLCGAVVILPLGGLAMRLVSLATRGKLRRPAFLSRDAVESAGWGVRLLATSAFVAGAVLYTPQALSLALDTDYPVAAVSSSSMSPALHEGELVLIEGVDSMDQLRPGDIVAFTYEDGLAVRRVAGVQDGAIVATADASPDQGLVISFDDIAGRVLTLAGAQVKLPFLGNISLLGERTVEPR